MNKKIWLWILLLLLVILPTIIGGIKSKPNTTDSTRAFYLPEKVTND